jgi:hypothetical protein
MGMPKQQVSTNLKVLQNFTGYAEHFRIYKEISEKPEYCIVNYEFAFIEDNMSS